LTDRILYFASCGTMAASLEELQDFADATGARAIVGYTNDVGWAESAAFDFTLLPELLGYVDLKRLYARLLKRHRYFVEGLGLRIATRSWTLPSAV
jgi:hypothetical protein